MPSPNLVPRTGGCLCGPVRYAVTAPISGLRACHCVNCQKTSGGAGTVNVVVPSDGFRITRCATRRYDDYHSHRNPDPGFLVVRAGSLDDSSGLKITGNIWTASARPWAHIDPATECHPGNMPLPPKK